MRGFGSRLKALRESRSLSQQELAERIGIHFSQLSRIERDVSTPSAETLVALNRALHISADTLLGIDTRAAQEPTVHNLRLLERFQALETLGADEQDTAIKLIDALVAKHRIQQALAS